MEGQIGVIGRGPWGDKCHATLISLKRDGINTSPRRVGKDDYLDMLMDPEVVGVVGATAIKSHESVGLAAIAEGANILMEKPLAWTLREADRLVEAYERCKVLVFGVELPMKVNEVLQAMKNKLYLIRPLKSLHFEFSQGTIRDGDDGLADIGPHIISAEEELTEQKPQYVRALELGPYETILTLGFPSISGTAKVKLDAEERKRFLRASGENGGELCMRWGSGPDKLYYTAPGEGEVDITPPQIHTALANSMLDFARCIQSGGQPESTIYDGWRGVKLIELLRESKALGGREKRTNL